MMKYAQERLDCATALDQIADLQRRLRRQRIMFGLLSTLVCVFITIVLVASADYLLRPQAEIARLALSISAMAAVVVAMRRWLVPAFRGRIDRVSAARRLERCHPQLGDRISSAVGLASPSRAEPVAGSSALRTAALRACERELLDVELSGVVDYGSVRRLAVMALLLLAAGAIFAGPRVPLVRTALARIVFPLRDHGWPRQIQLDIVHAPRRLAAGSDWNLRVVERSGKHPEDAVIRFRDASESTRRETAVPLTVTPEGMTARRRQVTRSFEFRVQAGDDRDMPWQRVDVIPPPRIVAFDVTTFPPMYTRQEPQGAPPDPVVLRGTGIQIVGRSSRPLERLAVLLDSGQRIPANVAEDGRQFKIGADRFRVDDTTTYAFELKGRDGLVSVDPQRHRIVVEDDPPPRIRFIEPREGLAVMPEASLPLHVVAEDNLFVETLALFYRPSDVPPDDERPVRAAVKGWKTSRQQVTEGQPSSKLPQRRTLRAAWDLTPLELLPGDDLILAAVATDARPGSSPGRVERHISVVGQSQWNRWLMQRQERVRRALIDAARLHRDAMKEIASVQSRAGGARRHGPSARDTLLSASRSEDDVRRLLADSDDGAVAHVQALLRMLHINEPGDQTLLKEWQRLLHILSEVGERRILEIQYAIDRAVDGMESADEGTLDGDPETVALQLNEIRSKQQAVARQLRQYLEQLARQTAWQEAAHTAREARDEHQSIIRKISDIAAKLLAGEPGHLEDSETRTLQELADRYRKMARQLAASVPAESNRAASGNSTLATPTAEVVATAQQLRNAARRLEQSQLGRVLEQQTRMTRQLDKVIKAVEAAASAASDVAEQIEETPESAVAGQPKEKGKDLRQRVLARLPSETRRWIAPWPDTPFVPRYQEQTEAYFRRLAEER